jgi:hypothetical protein
MTQNGRFADSEMRRVVQRRVGGEKDREGSVPDPFKGHHDPGGERGPKPCGDDGDGAASDLTCEIEERKCGSGGKKCVEENGGAEAGESDGSKDAEDEREQKRIDRGNPGGGAGVLAEEVAETFSLRESEGDVASFLFEGDSGEDLLGDFALLVIGEGEACGESGGGD